MLGVYVIAIFYDIYAIANRGSLRDAYRVTIRSFIEAGSSLARESIALPKDRAAAVALPLQMVYDLAAKSRFSLRFNCKNPGRK